MRSIMQEMMSRRNCLRASEMEIAMKRQGVTLIVGLCISLGSYRRLSIHINLFPLQNILIDGRSVRRIWRPSPKNRVSGTQALACYNWSSLL
jgi:hypothetical protein